MRLRLRVYIVIILIVFFSKHFPYLYILFYTYDDLNWLYRHDPFQFMQERETFPISIIVLPYFIINTCLALHCKIIVTKWNHFTPLSSSWMVAVGDVNHDRSETASEYTIQPGQPVTSFMRIQAILILI